jgi:hypothetical protein
MDRLLLEKVGNALVRTRNLGKGRQSRQDFPLRIGSL